MRWLPTLPLLALLLLVTQPGCATYTALSMDGPTDDGSVVVGMHRRDVERILQVPPSSEYEDHGLMVVRYEYSDGPPGGSKVRSLVYVAGDVFTLFLTELIFWPIELYADKRIKRVAIAEYDTDNALVDWTIERPDGETLAHQQVPVRRETPPAVSSPGPQEPAAAPQGSEEAIEQAGTAR